MQHQLIAGEQISKSGETLAIDDPATGEVVEEVVLGDAEDAEAAVAKHLDGKKAAYLTNMEGHQILVVAGVASTRQMFAEACETTNYELIQKFNEASENPRPYSEVDKFEATVKENVFLEDIDLIQMLPMPVHHEEDAGNYVTAGLFRALRGRANRRVANVSTGSEGAD